MPLNCQYTSPVGKKAGKARGAILVINPGQLKTQSFIDVGISIGIGIGHYRFGKTGMDQTIVLRVAKRVPLLNNFLVGVGGWGSAAPSPSLVLASGR